MNDTIDITGIDHAELLAALVNGTVPLGMGFLQPGAREPMTVERAREELSIRKDSVNVKFDYVCGRPIKVAFYGNTLDRADLYDRDAPGGKGACQRIVDALKAKTAR